MTKYRVDLSEIKANCYLILFICNDEKELFQNIRKYSGVRTHRRKKYKVNGCFFTSNNEKLNEEFKNGDSIGYIMTHKVGLNTEKQKINAIISHESSHAALSYFRENNTNVCNLLSHVLWSGISVEEQFAFIQGHIVEKVSEVFYEENIL